MADIKKQSVEDILKEVAQLRESLRNFRFNEAGSRTRNVREGRNIRKQIAQLLTEVRAREIASKQKTV